MFSQQEVDAIVAVIVAARDAAMQKHIEAALAFTRTMAQQEVVQKAQQAEITRLTQELESYASKD